MRRSISLLMTAAATAILPGTAQAAEPVAGCPPGFELRTVKEVLRVAAPGFRDAIRAMDENGDGHLCYKEIEAPLFDPTFLYYDNTTGLGTGNN